MKTEILERHPYFKKWTDPESGVVSYILQKKAAPFQQSFYFTNSSLSSDEKWLWFYIAFPPSPCKMLGAVYMDPADPKIYSFPEICIHSHEYHGGAMISDEGDKVFFCMGATIWSYKIGQTPEIVCSLDKGYINNRPLYQLATHISMSSDKKYFLLDGEFGNVWFVAVADIETGNVKILKEFTRRYNHAQFSPTDPKLFSIAQDWWHDKISGQWFTFDHRIWLMDIEQNIYEPVSPKDWFGHGTQACHEFWSKDGHLCWIDYKKGAFDMDLKMNESRNVWQRPLYHAHCDTTRNLWCADITATDSPKIPTKVSFYNSETKKEIDIVTDLPLPFHDGSYHIHPHPQFSPKDTYIVYTTTVLGSTDVALAPVRDLITRT